MWHPYPAHRCLMMQPPAPPWLTAHSARPARCVGVTWTQARMLRWHQTWRVCVAALSYCPSHLSCTPPGVLSLKSSSLNTLRQVAAVAKVFPHAAATRVCQQHAPSSKSVHSSSNIAPSTPLKDSKGGHLRAPVRMLIHTNLPLGKKAIAGRTCRACE